MQVLHDLLSQNHPGLFVFLLAMLPLFEARYAVIVAYVLNKKFGVMPWHTAFLLSVLGNVLAVIPLLYILPWLDRMMHKNQSTAKIMDYFLNRARKREDLIEKYGFWGLTVFVAVPLPVTGAWTGALMAYVFNVSRKKSILALFVGLVVAVMLMLMASYGGIEWLSVILPSTKA